MDRVVLEKHARDLMAVKAEMETALSELRAVPADAALLVAEITAVREKLEPLLASIADRQTVADEANLTSRPFTIDASQDALH